MRRTNSASDERTSLRWTTPKAGGALVALVLALAAGEARAFDIVNRWSATQLDGGALQRGDPVTLRWSVVPDGKSYDRSSNSQLIQFLDDGWNVPAAQRTPSFDARPWWTVINNAYAQYGRVSGVSFTYVAEQDAAGASTGMFGDVRLGGENLDGTPGGALADNVFPDGGDMRIDVTREANGSVGSYFSTEPGLRNLVIHETGHGVGLGHTEFVNNSAKAVMEGGLRTEIWGLQFDDVYALNRQYGDPQERSGGNNVATTATDLGAVALGGARSVGLDASDSVVQQFDDDWFGVDGTSDADWLKFAVPSEGFANIRLTPIGPSYVTVQNGAFDASRQSDLILQVFASAPGLSLLQTRDVAGLGGAEETPALFLASAGEYLVRVRGKQDVNQFYRLDVAVSELPLPGKSADVNLDGVADRDDWLAFVTHAGLPTTGLSARDAFRQGDLDGSGANDFTDFQWFKSAYVLANGAAAWESLAAVPEPAAASLATAAFGLAMLSGRRGRSSPETALSASP